VEVRLAIVLMSFPFTAAFKLQFKTLTKIIIIIFNIIYCGVNFAVSVKKWNVCSVVSFFGFCVVHI